MGVGVGVAGDVGVGVVGGVDVVKCFGSGTLDGKGVVDAKIADIAGRGHAPIYRLSYRSNLRRTRRLARTLPYSMRPIHTTTHH
ncbi:MAG: hypothetical protein AN483_20420, partial [Aphanizomenon flos-aquae MDT14a]